ncbi:MAG: glycine zipper 2TM domain-containing protein [Betaproteobacteria bacterium]
MTHIVSSRSLKATFASCLLTSLAVCLPAQAQEVGNVISRTAVYQQVSVPRQVCTQTQTNVPGQTSGAGAAMGAIAGGAIGNAMGKGEGRAIATMIGVIGGAIAGDKVEGPQATQTQTHQTCTTQQVYENRLTGYNVVYEFAGKQYNVQLPKDPGPTIKLQITPIL